MGEARRRRDYEAQNPIPDGSGRGHTGTRRDQIASLRPIEWIGLPPGMKPEDAIRLIPHPDINGSLMRFSTLIQDLGESRQRQYEDCEAFLRELGWPQPDIQFDLVAVSGFQKGVGDKPAPVLNSKNEFGSFCDTILHRKNDKNETRVLSRLIALMIEEFHRLGRQPEDVALSNFFKLHNAGVTICLTSPTKRRIYLGLNWVPGAGHIPKQEIDRLTAELAEAHASSRTKSEMVWRTKRKQRQGALDHGWPVPGMAPGWAELIDHVRGQPSSGSYVCYREEDDPIKCMDFSVLHPDFDPEKPWKVPMPRRVAVVRRIFKLSKDFGTTAIAQILNDEEVWCWSSKTGKWDGGYIAWLLKEESALGTLVLHELQEFEVDDPDTPGEKMIVTRNIEVGRRPGYFPQILLLNEWYESKAGTIRRSEERGLIDQNGNFIRGGSSGGPIGAGTGEKKRKGTPYPNLFKGRMFCACGAAMRWRKAADWVTTDTIRKVKAPDRDEPHYSANSAGILNGGIKSETVHARCQNPNYPDWYYVEYVPQVIPARPYYLCPKYSQHTCDNDWVYDATEFEDQVFGELFPAWAASPITIPTFNEDRINELTAEIVALTDEIRLTHQNMGSTQYAGELIAGYEKKLSELSATREIERAINAKKYTPDTLVQLHKWYLQTKTNPDNLLELRGNMAGGQRDVIQEIIFHKNGGMAIAPRNDKIAHTSARMGHTGPVGVELPRLYSANPRKRSDRRKGFGRAPKRLPVDAPVLKREIITIIKREGVAVDDDVVIRSTVLAQHTAKLEYPWQVTNAHMIALALKKLGIRPGEIMIHNDKFKGYALSQFVGENGAKWHLTSMRRRPNREIVLDDLLHDIRSIFRRKDVVLAIALVLHELHRISERWDHIHTPQRLAKILSDAGLKTVELGKPDWYYYPESGHPSKKGISLESIREALMSNGKILSDRSQNRGENIV